jgi:BirA family biotin operon repressor/biotin-[acetyl-CoA-carboxylase] ligase
MLVEASAGASPFVSGARAAEELGVTRAAVWKAVQALEDEGVGVESVRAQGYRLTGAYDELDEAGLVAYLPADLRTRVTLHVARTTGSTNTDAKTAAEAGAPAYSCFVASEQVEGRGRRGRPFYSLGDTGVYLSIVLRPTLAVAQSGLITSAAAVAVCRAIEDLLPEDAAQIKWVNDVYVSGRKVSGILTEASVDLESGGFAYAVVGIGVNVYVPEGGFPEGIAQRAGALLPGKRTDFRNKLAAGIIARFIELYEHDPFNAFVPEYQERSFLTGRTVEIKGGDHDGAVARVEGIGDDLGLVVVLSNGERAVLRTGEVSIAVQEGR